MSYSHRPKAERRRERLINTSITASGARDMESTKVMLNETGEGSHSSFFDLKLVCLNPVRGGQILQ